MNKRQRKKLAKRHGADREVKSLRKLDWKYRTTYVKGYGVYLRVKTNLKENEGVIIEPSNENTIGKWVIPNAVGDGIADDTDAVIEYFGAK